ncbi:hypothetical protein HAHE_31810 [Haloferula helveola]|uniref:Outer membrane lipoprotein BamD-like domain-containing protein n=1 Tax=Haloferula helveola TaxID=490095 RepID=A0ABN6H809_9BACT|nr:hypothetical protein HAHE_31810 [Haloferula helveola]
MATFEAMREVERYQLKIAEKHYTNKNYKVALAEYEKFLTLYETSPGAPYAQLMWSHTMVHLKKPQTALREGFQSVIDYWPESHEATVAAYCIGDAYRKMGEVKKAQDSFEFIIKEYPSTLLALRSKQDLLHYAKLHEDQDKIIEILKDLTFKTERTEQTNGACVQASEELARKYFFRQEFEEGRKALATSYKDGKLIEVVHQMTVQTMQHLLKDEKTKAAALKLGDQLIASVRRDAAEDPEHAKGHLYRVAALHAMLGRPSDVWKLYKEVEEKFGRDDDLRGRMAEWNLARDKRDEARRLFAEFDNVVVGQERIAGMFKEEGKFKEAIAVYVKLLDLNGDGAAGYQWAIGGCYESMSDWRNAIGMYRQIDDFPKTHFAMASCHRKLGEQQEAILLYNQCKVVDNAAPRASIEIGFTYEEAEEPKNAIRTFQLTCKRYPKSGEAARAHAHLQNKYNINVTLGGAEDE